MYYGDASNRIGFVVSDSPTGPFTDPKGSAVIDKTMPNCNTPWCFDPTVFIDDDRQAYCIFGGKPDNVSARIIKLKSDMMNIDGAALTIDAPSFFEGAWLHKHTVNNVSKYYFSYFAADVPTIRIDYMMSDHPMGPWKYGGRVMPN
jgi:arabinoxylan arabinofuranohydrolase